MTSSWLPEYNIISDDRRQWLWEWYVFIRGTPQMFVPAENGLLANICNFLGPSIFGAHGYAFICQYSSILGMSVLLLLLMTVWANIVQTFIRGCAALLTPVRGLHMWVFPDQYKSRAGWEPLFGGVAWHGVGTIHPINDTFIDQHIRGTTNPGKNPIISYCALR